VCPRCIVVGCQWHCALRSHAHSERPLSVVHTYPHERTTERRDVPFLHRPAGRFDRDLQVLGPGFHG
jgi:hypothetical protein